MFKFIEFKLVKGQYGQNDVMVNVQHITHVTDGMADTTIVHMIVGDPLYVKHEYCVVMDRLIMAERADGAVYIFDAEKE